MRNFEISEFVDFPISKHNDFFDEIYIPKYPIVVLFIFNGLSWHYPCNFAHKALLMAIVQPRQLRCSSQWGVHAAQTKTIFFKQL